MRDDSAMGRCPRGGGVPHGFRNISAKAGTDDAAAQISVLWRTSGGYCEYRICARRTISTSVTRGGCYNSC